MPFTETALQKEQESDLCSAFRVQWIWGAHPPSGDIKQAEEHQPRSSEGNWNLKYSWPSSLISLTPVSYIKWRLNFLYPHQRPRETTHTHDQRPLTQCICYTNKSVSNPKAMVVIPHRDFSIFCRHKFHCIPSRSSEMGDGGRGKQHWQQQVATVLQETSDHSG